LPDAKVPAHEIETWPVDRLKPYERNARTHSKKQILQLQDSFKKFGQVWPLLVREDGTLIAGHGRLEAAKLEGLTEVRVIVAAGWTEEQCRAFSILDNKVALNSEWDEALLGIELAALGGLGVDLESLGFDPLELDKLLPSSAGLTDPDDVPPPPATPVSRAGDVWILGRHRLLCGDSTKAEDVARALGTVKPHLMVTDPPYGVSYDPTWREGADLGIGKRSKGKVTNDDRADWSEAWALFPGSIAYVWHGGLHSRTVQENLESAGFMARAQIIWVKQHFVLSRGDYHWQHEPCWYAVRGTGNWAGDRKQTTVWEIKNNNSFGNADKEKTWDHGTQKPVECMKRPIENNSSPGQAVYDPFVGSGTTIIAAEMTGRAAITIDCDPVYVDVAVLRWQEFTVEKATLDDDGRDFESVAAERLPKAA